MAQPTMPVKQENDGVNHDEMNNLVECVKSKADGARKAFNLVNARTGTDLLHGFGEALQLPMTDYLLEVRAYDSNGYLVGGISVQKTTADLATLVYENDIPYTGPLVLDATPF